MPMRQLPYSTLLLAALCPLVGSCGRHEADRAANDSTSHAASAAGSVLPASDTTNAISATTDAVGPGIQVTNTDEHSVSRSFDLRLTTANWTKFLHAADSVAALRARDPEVRQHLDEQIVGAKEDDAGEKWLATNAKVAAAITGAGLSVKDYYRLGLTIAAAARFMDNPSAAPPTPSGRENAQFVRDHRSELVHLQDISRGGTGAVQAR